MQSDECVRARECLQQRRQTLLAVLKRLCKNSFASPMPTHNYSLRPLKVSVSVATDACAVKLHSSLCLKLVNDGFEELLHKSLAQAQHPQCSHGCVSSALKLTRAFKVLLNSRTYAQWKALREALQNQIQVSIHCH